MEAFFLISRASSFKIHKAILSLTSKDFSFEKPPLESFQDSIITLKEMLLEISKYFPLLPEALKSVIILESKLPFAHISVSLFLEFNT